MLILIFPPLIEAGAIFALSSVVFYRLDKDLGNRLAPKIQIAISRWIWKHVFRMLSREEKQYIYEYDQIRTVSSIIVYTLAIDVLTLICVLLFIETIIWREFKDVLLLQIPFLILLVIVIKLFRESRKLKENSNSQIQFLRHLEWAQRSAHWAATELSATNEEKELAGAILGRLAELSKSNDPADRDEYVKLTTQYAQLRLNAPGAIKKILKEYDREFEDRWRQSSVDSR